MLDDYKDEQPIIYKIITNQIKKDSLSHAYIFETLGYYQSFEFIMAIIKTILCPKKHFNKKNCGKCFQCEVIESGNFPEIKIINPDGMWIKKEQLKELQTEFNEKAIIGNKKIYIINGAEKLNKSSANSMLKFLEEPDNNIIAILLTENIYEVLETIRSRCQVLKLKESKLKEEDNTISKLKQILTVKNNDPDEKIEKAIEFVNYYEIHGKDTILYINKLWNEYYKTKEDYINAFEIMILYYKDILNKKMDRKLEIFDKSKSINEISEKSTIKEICKKLNIIIKIKESIKYNVNLNLTMDKLIIELDGGKRNDRSSRNFIWRRKNILFWPK